MMVDVYFFIQATGDSADHFIALAEHIQMNFEGEPHLKQGLLHKDGLYEISEISWSHDKVTVAAFPVEGLILSANPR